MLKWNADFAKVIEVVKTGRREANPNRGFVDQLVLFQKVVKLYHQKIDRNAYPNLNYEAVKPWKLVATPTGYRKVMMSPINFGLLEALMNQEMHDYLQDQKHFIAFLKARNQIFKN